MAETSATKVPLFSIDLGFKGGIFSPSDITEIINWIAEELSFWSWINPLNSNYQDQAIRQAIGRLNESADYIRRASANLTSNPNESTRLILEAERSLKEAFITHGLPHSSSTLGKRIADYRKENDQVSALYFASVFIPPSIGNHFQPQDLNAWRGLVEGLVDKYSMGSNGQKAEQIAAIQSFEQLKSRVDVLLNEKTGQLNTLQQEYDAITGDINWQRTEQLTKFDETQTQRNSDFEKLLLEHKSEMENLRKIFKEEIALRAPAEYWTKKHSSHLWQSVGLGIVSFLSMLGFVFFAKNYVHDLLGEVKSGTLPESWKVATLVLIGLFSVWAVRILVRMFLSQLHLATDASERVVMVQTYLSLLEGDQLISKEDRHLILQALFRPASDGIVKDEGLPPSVFEFMTRTSKA
ncbi:DUF6161 domain-containing protein [Undibacterium flavidum]|uniref:DUF6161 domain-containing protein n=1 Tax=Undibacterium flavidum TaxID=2762297 RepID=A0ABR6YA49_9BURK|nr:DUF6161 domain-containing protein [Undibacterium flavidum]MBC3873506.1 hypothetical protein [Undibacterium flavidum]